MECGKVFNGNSNKNMVNVLLHHRDHQRLPCNSSSSSEGLDSRWLPKSSPFHGSASMVNFDENSKGRPFFPQSDKEENGNEDYDGCSFHHPEKKRRLLPEQVQFLEKSFDVENKLEPERKVQLAREIGLQPRQVAIWFQNRRARYKTKQLEKEYDSLKANYNKLKADYDSLFNENEKLKNEVHMLTEKLLISEKGKVKSEPCDPISTFDAEAKKLCENVVSGNESSAPGLVCKQEDASSAKSDVFDSDSPRYTDVNHSSFLDPTDDSSNIFEPDPSDFSQDEDDSLSKRLLRASSFPKLEVECYNDLQANPCIMGLPVEDHSTWFWNY